MTSHLKTRQGIPGQARPVASNAQGQTAMPQGAHLQAPPQGAQINPQGQQHLISQTAMRPGGPSIAFQQNPQVRLLTCSISRSYQ